MAAFKVSENVYWVGVNDWALKDFHGLYVPRGGSYNSYLILGEKKALIDTVYKRFTGDFIRKISEVTPLEEIDYVVANHSEVDHSSSLPEVLKAAPRAKVVTNKKCQAMLQRLFGIPSNRFFPVKNGDKLSLGNFTLQFIEQPMVHWPETMFTYLMEEKVLFPCDFLGTQMAASPLLVEDTSDFTADSRAYYTFIMRPFNEQVLKGVHKVRELSPQIVAPSHGPVLKGTAVEQILKKYEIWSTSPETRKVVIPYVSLWGGTGRMAELIAEGVELAGVPVKVMNLTSTPMSEVISEALEAKFLAVGSPTLVKGIHPLISAFLVFLEMIKPGNKKGMVFGTFGWNGNAGKITHEMMEKMGVRMVEDPLLLYLTPTPEDCLLLIEKGKTIAAALE